jgi:cytoskeletal protein CcmA (bactofilin family)
MQLKSIFRFLGKPAAATVIGTETEFRGEVRSKHEIQIDGAVIGNVIGPITIGPQGSVEGDIEAGRIEVAGRVHGNITATEILIVRSTARIEGDIHYASVSVEHGAQMLGMMKAKTATETQAPIQTRLKPLSAA